MLRRSLQSIEELPILAGSSEVLAGAAKRIATGAVVESRYIVNKRLADHGTLEVYEGRQLDVYRKVALRTLDLPSMDGEEAELNSMIFEAAQRRVQKVTHPSLLKVYGFGVNGKQPYIVTELVSGHDCRAELKKKGALKPTRAYKLIVGALEGLAEAHRNGITHRGIRPEALFIKGAGTSDERLVILDFGVAEVVYPFSEDSTGRNAADDKYLPTEFLETGDVSPATDVFQVAVTLVELLTNVPVVNPDAPRVAGQKHLKVPAGLLTSTAGPVLLKALSAKAEDRYANAGELREALISVKAGFEELEAKPENLDVLTTGEFDFSSDDDPSVPAKVSVAPDGKITRESAPTEEKSEEPQAASTEAKADEAAEGEEPTDAKAGDVKPATDSPEPVDAKPEVPAAAPSAAPAADAKPETQAKVAPSAAPVRIASPRPAAKAGPSVPPPKVAPPPPPKKAPPAPNTAAPKPTTKVSTPKVTRPKPTPPADVATAESASELAAVPAPPAPSSPEVATETEPQASKDATASKSAEEASAPDKAAVSADSSATTSDSSTPEKTAKANADKSAGETPAGEGTSAKDEPVASASPAEGASSKPSEAPSSPDGQAVASVSEDDKKSGSLDLSLFGTKSKKKRRRPSKVSESKVTTISKLKKEADAILDAEKPVKQAGADDPSVAATKIIADPTLTSSAPAQSIVLPVESAQIEMMDEVKAPPKMPPPRVPPPPGRKKPKSAPSFAKAEEKPAAKTEAATASASEAKADTKSGGFFEHPALRKRKAMSAKKTADGAKGGTEPLMKVTSDKDAAKALSDESKIKPKGRKRPSLFGLSAVQSTSPAVVKSPAAPLAPVAPETPAPAASSDVLDIGIPLSSAALKAAKAAAAAIAKDQAAQAALATSAKNVVQASHEGASFTETSGLHPIPAGAFDTPDQLSLGAGQPSVKIAAPTPAASSPMPDLGSLSALGGTTPSSALEDIARSAPEPAQPASPASALGSFANADPEQVRAAAAAFLEAKGNAAPVEVAAPKTCPYCSAALAKATTICNYCGGDVSSAAPVAPVVAPVVASSPEPAAAPALAAGAALSVAATEETVPPAPSADTGLDASFSSASSSSPGFPGLSVQSTGLASELVDTPATVKSVPQADTAIGSQSMVEAYSVNTGQVDVTHTELEREKKKRLWLLLAIIFVVGLVFVAFQINLDGDKPKMQGEGEETAATGEKDPDEGVATSGDNDTNTEDGTQGEEGTDGSDGTNPTDDTNIVQDGLEGGTDVVPDPGPVMVDVVVKSDPRGALIYDGDKEVGVTPYTHKTETGTQVTFTLKKAGFEEQTVSFIAGADAPAIAELKKRKADTVASKPKTDRKRNTDRDDGDAGSGKSKWQKRRDEEARRKRKEREKAAKAKEKEKEKEDSGSSGTSLILP